MYSRPRRACYPQGSLSDSLIPHQKGFKVRYARISPLRSILLETQSILHLSFSLYSGFLTRMSRTLGALVSFSRAYRPSQTIHLMLSFCKLAIQKLLSGVTLLHSQFPEKLLRRSHLHSVVTLISQHQAIVKLHGVFVSLWKSPVSSPGNEFTRSQAGTVGESLRHSCKPPIKRRGITLP